MGIEEAGRGEARRPSGLGALVVIAAFGCGSARHGGSLEHDVAIEHDHGGAPVRGEEGKKATAALCAGAPTNSRAVVISGGNKEKKGGVLDGDEEEKKRSEGVRRDW